MSLRRPISSGSRRISASTGAPSGVAPNSITSVSSRRNAADQPDPLREPLADLALVILIVERDQLLDRVHGGAQLASGNDRARSAPTPPRNPPAASELEASSSSRTAAASFTDARASLRVLAGALLVGLALGLPEQLGDHQQVKQLKAIIDRRGLQMHDRRQQRRAADATGDDGAAAGAFAAIP